MPVFKEADRLSNVPTSTVWQEITMLAKEHKAVNLGPGSPSFSPPVFLLRELQNVIDQSEKNPSDHQYARIQGDFQLVTELKRIYAQRLSQPNLTDSNVLITNGVTQGLNVAFQALLNPGDETVIFEPYFDAYIHDIQMAGGVVKFVQLIPGNTNYADSWYFTEESLLSVITPKTKFILLNTPQNIPGKVWSQSELEIVARISIKYNLIVIVDEVYMSLTYESTHISLASLPNMWERVITLCSSGKTFCCTGWKIGWAIGPSNFITSMTKVTTYQTYSVASPLQIAFGRALHVAEEEKYYSLLIEGYIKRRKLLLDILYKSGLIPIIPSGGFFVLADISKIDPKYYYNPEETKFTKDWQFCRWMTKTIGVSAIPTTSFCTEESYKLYERYVRFTFCKTDEDISEAGVRLEKLRDYLLP